MKIQFHTNFYHVYQAEKRILTSNKFPVNNNGCPENIVNIISKELNLKSRIVCDCIGHGRYLKPEFVDLLHRQNVTNKFFQSIRNKKILLVKSLMNRKVPVVEIEDQITEFTEIKWTEYHTKDSDILGKENLINAFTDDLKYAEKIILNGDVSGEPYAPPVKRTFSEAQSGIMLDQLLKMINQNSVNILESKEPFTERVKMVQNLAVNAFQIFGEIS